jgi:hypothetical protein
MDLAMSHQMENQLNGDFYHLLGFSSPKEEVRLPYITLWERCTPLRSLKSLSSRSHLGRLIRVELRVASSILEGSKD